MKIVNDLSDPKKAKTYAGALQRAGRTKAIVDYVFSGSRYKLFVPTENCYIMFALSNVRSPQPSPNPGAVSRGQGTYIVHPVTINCIPFLANNSNIHVTTARAAEPFGDASKRHARVCLQQRQVEIECSGVTQGGVMTGDLYVGQEAQRRNYCVELVASGLATVDQRKIDYGEAPKVLIDSQTAAQNNKLGIWSIQQVVKNEPKLTSYSKYDDRVLDIHISEIRSGNHFFFTVVDNESAKVIEDGMKTFTETNGTAGAPCDIKAGKIVAALFNDGSSNSWYRAKIIEKTGKGKVKVLFVDHGNVADVFPATHLRPLDVALGVDQIPAVAKEAILALVKVRSLEEDDGIDAARTFQSMAWGKDLKARLHGETDGKAIVTLYDSDLESLSINEKLTSEGLARLGKRDEIYTGNSDSLVKLVKDLRIAQDKARSSRKGMWIYGEIPEEDDD